MSRIFFFIFFFLIEQTDAYSQKTSKALFVIVDGIPADVMERLRPSVMFNIAKIGGYTRAYVGGEKNEYFQTPTISAVGYNSLLTGTWANKHNVWDNYGKGIDSINYNYWHIFRLFKSQYPNKKTAIFSTWEDNRIILLGSKAKGHNHFQPDYFFDGLELDTIKFPHDTAGLFYNDIDKAVAQEASSYIKSNAPDLSWVYLEFTDEMGHRHGNGQIFDDAVMKIDQLIKPIWDAVQYREKNFNEDWVIYITTDHGREDNGYHHGGQSKREKTTWIITNKNLNTRYAKSNPAIVDIFPTLASHLNISIPRNKYFELDGVPIVGPVSAVNPKAVLKGNTIEVEWKPIEKAGNAKIWITTTNHFKTGGIDNYKLMKIVPVSKEKAIVNIREIPSDFYKISIEYPYNFLNRWVFKR